MKFCVNYFYIFVFVPLNIDAFLKSIYDPSFPVPSHIMNEKQFKQLHAEIQKADRFLLVAHQKPDGDALGATTSMIGWLLDQGKDVTAFCLHEPPEQYRFLDHVHHFTNDASVFDRAYDLVIILDSGDLKYCGVENFVPRLPKGHKIINIDHHPTNQNYGHMNFVFPNASSTAEILHDFYDHNNIRIDHKMATSLLTGLYYDTGNFSNSATSASSIRMAAKMYAAGARHNDIAQSLQNNKSVDTLKLWGLVLSRLHLDPETDIATTYVLHKDLDGLPEEVANGLSNFLNEKMGEAETTMFLKELPSGEIQGSIRSTTQDVSKIAQQYGGGGHKKAAGFRVRGRIKVSKDGGARIVTE